MILVMSSELVFPKVRERETITIRRVSRVVIQSSWKELTDRCEITIPRNVLYFNKHRVKDVFQVGDPVSVKLGYNGQLSDEFSGYIISVSADMPVVIKCEDEMWKLKQLPVSFSAAKTTLKELLTTICKGYDVDCLEGVQLGGIRLAKTTVAKVLEKLQQDFNLYSYMKGKQLVCGKYYSDDSSLKPIKFDLERNVVSNGLQYRSKDAIRLLIKGISLLASGKKIEFEVGDAGGDRLELSYYNVQLVSELERLVRLDYDKRKQDGFDGSFTAFGIPRVQHGWKVDLVSTRYEDRQGQYYIEGVTKDYSENGYRQEIKLGDKVA